MSLYPKRQGLYDGQYEHDACGIGAVVDIQGRPAHAILQHGKDILKNLRHRGAASADNVTGDGAGILFQIPHELFRSEYQAQKRVLPDPGAYGVAMLFLPKKDELRAKCEEILIEAVAHYGLGVIGWREVPTKPDCLGEIALSSEPVTKQLFIHSNGLVDEALERSLYMARKRAERIVADRYGEDAENFYVVSMSSRTIGYKGMFMDWQLFAYYPDLEDERTLSALCIVHQRYSTNTFPAWKLAQPFRCVAHNGEINTLSGNRNSMRGREPKMVCPALGEDLTDLFPVVDPTGSDSAAFDNALELLVQSGRSMPHGLMMMMPEAFGPKYHISTDKRAFYEYHAAVMEPWDGPAAMVFTDGRMIGGTLDRNGLRPCRYLVTHDGLAIIGSEAGVVDIPPEKVASKGRLRPGHLFLIDTHEGRIISDNETKSKIARQKPYRRWLVENRIELRGLFDAPDAVETDFKATIQQMRAFGYTMEENRKILAPMATNGQEPVGSMGNDTPMAVLSDRSKLMFNYFRQLFAQVTNPAIDPLREGLVMSLMVFTGKKRNILDETPEHCRQLKLPHPILTSADLVRLREARRPDFRVATVPMLFDANPQSAGKSLRKGLNILILDTEQAVRDGASLVILSDRNLCKEQAAIPSLLAVSAVHHNLLRKGLRNECGLIVESGEPREVMHFCLLAGYGANAVNPYLAFEVLHEMNLKNELPRKMEPVEISDHYIAAIKKGILKTMSKMGISTLRSYMYAQLFEAIGLNQAFVDEYFSGTASRIEGIGLDEVAQETLKRHTYACCDDNYDYPELEAGGDYAFRFDGEHHLWNPTTVSKLQQAVQNDDAQAYEEFAKAVNDQSRKLCTLRGMFDFKTTRAISIDKVEPASEIVKRFCTGAMSHGSISKEAHECMAIAMNRLGGKSNTGEGGEDPARYILEENGDSKNSAIKQVASGRFGVTINYLAHAKELQIKVAQGAKPGEGGQLPGHKVTQDIATLRYSTPGVTLISPPPHHDIYSIEDLAQLIYDLKCSCPGAKVSVKLVSEVGVGTIAAGVVKGNADEVLISGHDGGTGASPLSSIMHAGAPWELGLAETQQTLVLNNLRGRTRLQTDGQLRTGRDVVIGALLGADQFGFGTGALVTLGCTLLRKCHEGNCIYGIATQDPELRKRFAGKPEYITRYLTFVAEEIRQWMAKLGFKKFEDMVGRSDLLKTSKVIHHWKAKGLDLSSIFHQVDTGDERPIHLCEVQQDKHQDHMDWKLIEMAQEAIDNKRPVVLDLPIRNTDRTIGAILSNKIVLRHGPEGLPDDTVQVTLRGSAGQSFGAFLAKGITLQLIGESNDYLGKSLSGGRIIVKTPPEATYQPHENIIVGNTLLYGATRGEVFINGVAGERFAVRNSGAIAVVEGVGDHACEYMTGGCVVVLGKTGCNFAAGMSGGTAYVLDERQLFDTLCNLDMVDLENVWQQEDQDRLRDLIERHHQATDSERAQAILKNWPGMIGRFVKIMPIDYRKALERMQAAEQRNTETTPATEEVFHG
jgi:glutamate synthase domain-containing protein 2/glutamate synthase domain-containing protein 1/glutamate synthase domain-containing protein 3